MEDKFKHFEEVDITLNIKSNRSYPQTANLMGNPYNPLDTSNAVTEYKWDLTSFVFTTETYVTLQYRDSNQLSFGLYTQNILAQTLDSVVDALNLLGIGFFNTYTSGGSTFIATSNDQYVFGDLSIEPTGGTTTTTTTSTTTASPTTTTTTTSTTTAASTTTTTTTTSTTTAASTTTTTTTSTTTAAPDILSVYVSSESGNGNLANGQVYYSINPPPFDPTQPEPPGLVWTLLSSGLTIPECPSAPLLAGTITLPANQIVYVQVRDSSGVSIYYIGYNTADTCSSGVVSSLYTFSFQWGGFGSASSYLRVNFPVTFPTTTTTTTTTSTTTTPP